MGRRNSKKERRDNNLVPSRIYVTITQKKQTYRPKQTRLHLLPSPPRTPAADAYRRLITRPRTPEVADNRFWHPLGVNRPVSRYDGRPAPKTRLYDAPRGLPATNKKWSQRRNSAAVQSRRAQLSRFGPQLDRQTKAILAFTEPHTLPLCHQRQARKQVLHARGIAGGRVSRPQFKPNSKVSCNG